MAAASNNKDGASSSELIGVVGNTTYFTAASAWGMTEAGETIEFLPHQHDNNNKIHFYKNCPVCSEYLLFPYNSSTTKQQESFYVSLGEAPTEYPGEYLYKWSLDAAWKTPKFRWEWLEIGWQSRGKAVLPLVYPPVDLLQCDYMEFNTRSRGKLVIENGTMGAYLPEGFAVEDLKVYLPCGSSTCRILNNQVYCKEFGWPAKETWGILIPGGFVLFILLCCLYGVVTVVAQDVCAKRRRRRRVEQEINPNTLQSEQSNSIVDPMETEHEEIGAMEVSLQRNTGVDRLHLEEVALMGRPGH